MLKFDAIYAIETELIHGNGRTDGQTDGQI